MTHPVVRTLRSSDVARLPALVYACNCADGWAFRETVESLDPASASPELPAACWQVADEDGRLVGLATLGREKGARMYSLLWVLPERRGIGIEGRLASAMIPLARRLPEPSLDIAVRQTQKPYGDALANELGFSFVRTWYVMRMELGGDLPVPALPPGVAIRSFVPGQDEAMLTGVIDDCFWDHWGEGEHTLEETVHDVNLPMFDRELLLFAEREGQVLGYCWSWIDATRARVTGENCAYIGDLGVRLAFRHQGVGRSLLLRALAEIKSRGATAAELDMDGPNEKARLLYESVGFFPHIEVRWFRLAL